MNVYQRRTIFRRRNESSVYRMFFWVVLILGGIWLIRSVQRGDVKPLFLPTPTPTRFAYSYALEGDAQFTAGQLEAAIIAYQEAAEVDPNNAKVWADLARIQTYSSAMLVNDEPIRARLAEAVESAKKAVEVSPDDSYSHAVHAFALDWSASWAGDPAKVQELLTQAENEAVRALQLDNSNTLALAFYAEILVDQQKWSQGEQNIRQALERDPSLMDVHRVNASVHESLGQYNLAIQSYDQAIALAPNLTFLYLRAGANYRQLGFDSLNEDTQRQLYEKSLEYFAKAARINEQLGVEDPIPYLSISSTYSQMGEFFIAARNVQRALEFQPENADIYARLGIIYYRSRNYEGSIPALKCAVRGCTAEESCDGRGGCGPNDTPAQVIGLALSPNTLDYYIYYGSALALLGPRDPTYCPETLRLMAEVRAAGYDSDPIVANNILINEDVCSDSPSGGGSAATNTAGTPTSDEAMEETLTVTPSP